MKIVILLAVVATAVAYKDLPDEYYSTLVTDLNALRELFTCLLDKGPCNEFGLHTKDHVKEVLKDGCNECDVVQKHFTHVLITTARNKLPELYRQFEAKYGKRLDTDLDDKIKNY